MLSRVSTVGRETLIKYLATFSVFLIAVILRFGLSSRGFHVDIFSNAGWGEWIAENGPLGFYENSVWVYSWPTQPPFISLVYGFTHSLYIWFLELLRWSANTIVTYHLAPGHMVWWFDFVIWFDNPLTTEVWFPYGFLISIKSIPIIADVLIAGVIFWLAKRLKRNPLVWSAVYLFSPFTWYLSSLWGQYGQVAYLFALAAFLLTISLPVLSPLLMAISISLKPTTLIFLPLFMWIFLKRKPKKETLIIGVLLAAFFIYFTIQPFTADNPLLFIKEVLVPKILLKSEFRVSTNSYNFWHILTLDKALSDNTRFLLLPAKVWGYLAFILINIKGFRLLKKLTYKNIFGAMFLISAGSWLFLTNMNERYLFLGVASGLFVCLYKPKLFKYWLIMSLIYWLNLYRQWWFPEFLFPLKNILTAGGGFIGIFISVINIYLYLRMAKNILKPGK